LALKTLFFALLLYLIWGDLQKKRPPLTLNWMLNRLTRCRFFHRLELLIKASAVDKHIPFFNGYVFLAITLLIFLGVSSFLNTVTRSWAVSIGFSALASIIPRLLLELLRVINIRRIRHNYHGFLSSLMGFFALSGDVIGGYQSAADYSGEPLKTYVKDAVYRYQRSNLDFEVCLDELAERANEREFVKLIKFTKVYLAYGGNFSTTLEKLNNQASRLEQARLSLYSSGYVGIIAIAVMMAIDFMAFFSIYIRDPASVEVMGSTLTGAGLLFFNLASVILGIVISFRIFRGDI